MSEFPRSRLLAAGKLGTSSAPTPLKCAPTGQIARLKGGRYEGKCQSQSNGNGKSCRTDPFASSGQGCGARWSQAFAEVRDAYS